MAHLRQSSSSSFCGLMMAFLLKIQPGRGRYELPWMRFNWWKLTFRDRTGLNTNLLFAKAGFLTCVFMWANILSMISFKSLPWNTSIIQLLNTCLTSSTLKTFPSPSTSTLNWIQAVVCAFITSKLWSSLAIRLATLPWVSPKKVSTSILLLPLIQKLQ